MKLVDIILVGVALAMDAFALTIANCTTYKSSLNRKNEWSMPVAFALFQGLMPLIGYYIGSLFFDYVAGFIDYITAGIFFLLALKIVIDIIKDKRAEKKKESDCELCKENPEKKTAKFTVWVLLIQALATSIDALAVGVTLTASSISVFVAIGIIAGVTLIIVTIALLIGKFLGNLLGNYATYFGALLLFALSIKCLIQAII